ncbi:MAG: hypothetical protein HYS55_02685 [Candidatus Omnitrophica bacterium]|nr:hypothetical protein [Candidatus Omnitrophota bacterium]
MPTTEFLDRITTRLERIDKKSLETYVLRLVEETKFFGALLDQVLEGVMVLTPKKEVLFLNKRMEQLFNISEVGKRSGVLSEMISDTALANFISDTIDEKRELFQEEFETLLPRPMVLKINLVFEKKKTPSLFILTVTNVTQVETNIREQFKIENWETMLALASGIAHEIGNPLNSLIIHLGLLDKTIAKLPVQEKRKIEKTVQVMKGETKRLDQIVRNFLRATRRKPLKFELTQVNDLVLKTLELLKPELKEAKIRVIKNLDGQMQAFLLDSERLYQVFVNIIKNAIHAMPKGGTLEIRTKTKGKLCLVHFQDSGIGIPDDKLPKIFDAYYTTKEEGSGLGLMIVYQIIREHGGRIEVTSKPNVGTTFSCILPIRTEKLSLPEPPKKVSS